MKKIIALLLLCFAVTNCEKDDICSDTTSTTARVFIQFYNSANIDNFKNAAKLRVQGVGVANDVALSDYNIVTTNKVYLPLKTTETETQFILHKDYVLNDDGSTEGSSDIITISYTPTLEYVSKACGYKTVFENVTITVEVDSNSDWIDRITSMTNNQPISNEDEAHFNLFH